MLFWGRDQGAVEGLATQVGAAIRGEAEALGVHVLGPAPQALPRLRNQYRWHVLLKSARGQPLRDIARRALACAEAARTHAVRVAADVDPIEVL